MTDSAHAIIGEFLRSGEPQLRRNALTALSALGTDEGLHAVVQTALHDPDATVRARAEVELAAVLAPPSPAEARAHAVRQIDAAIADPHTARAAYALVARLWERGVDVPATRGPWRARLRLGRDATRANGFLRELSSVAGLVPATVVGSTVGGIVLAAAFLYAFGRPATGHLSSEFIVGGLVAGPFFTVIIGWRALTASQLVDRAAAVAVATMRIAVVTAVLLVSVALLASTTDPTAFEDLGALLATTATVAIAIRLGTLAVYRPSGGSAAARQGNVLLQSSVGALVGVGVLTTWYLLFPRSDAFWDKTGVETWIEYVVGAFGGAAAAARLDHRHDGGRPAPRRVRGFAIAIAAVVALASAIAVIGTLPTVRHIHRRAIAAARAVPHIRSFAGPGIPPRTIGPLESLPATVALSALAGDTLAVTADASHVGEPNDSASGFRLVVTLLDSARVEVATAGDSVLPTTRLVFPVRRPGRYEAVIYAVPQGYEWRVASAAPLVRTKSVLPLLARSFGLPAGLPGSATEYSETFMYGMEPLAGLDDAADVGRAATPLGASQRPRAATVPEGEARTAAPRATWDGVVVDSVVFRHRTPDSVGTLHRFTLPVRVPPVRVTITRRPAR